MTHPMSTALSTLPAIVRSIESQHRLKPLGRLLARWAPLTALIGTSAFALMAHPLIILGYTPGYYMRP